MRRCPLCGSPLYDEGGLLVCGNCGFIADEDLVPSVFDRNDSPMMSRSRSLEHIGRELGLPDEVIKLAEELVRAYNSLHGRIHTSSILLAALVVASRLQGSPIPIKEAIRRLSIGVSPSRVAFYVGKIDELIPRKGVPWEGYINYLIAKMSRDEEFMRKLEKASGKVDPKLLLERLRMRALKEMKELRNRKRSILVGRNPVYIAAAVVYMAGRKIGMRYLSQGMIADLLGANRSTISKVLGLVK